MTAVPSTITRDVRVDVIAAPEGSRQIPVVLHYDTADPYAVRAVFRVAGDQEVVWVFARELATRGLDQPSGEGDVRIWPTYDHGREVVRIALRSPDGEALLQATYDEVVDFLSSTYLLCPRGREHRYVRIDDALGEFFMT
jgi:hypothetical protein